VYELSSLKLGQDVILIEILWLFGEIACASILKQTMTVSTFFIIIHSHPTTGHYITYAVAKALK